MWKFLGMILCMCFLFSGNCFAMQFSQPVKIGGICVDQSSKQGVLIENASYNNGDYYIKAKKDNRSTYGKGMARFGNGEDALYVHYNYYTDFGKFYFGGKDKQNTIVPPNVLTIYDIFRINTDKKITIYPLRKFYSAESDYIIIGRRADGKFVKYIDTREITKRYFSWDGTGASSVTYHDLYTQGNTLIMKYQRYGYKQLIEGTFYFKWDDNAQWFGVEQGTETVIRSW